MGFHSESTPTDWVTLTPAARLGMFYDADLTASAVTYRMNWVDEPIADPFTYPDNTSLSGVRTPSGYRLWNLAGAGGTVSWAVTSNTLRFTGTAVRAVAYVNDDTSDTDVTVECRATTGKVGLAIHAQNLPGNFLRIQPGQAVALENALGTTYWTGTATASADTWHTLRVKVASSMWTVWVDGVQQGDPFSHTVNQTFKEVGVGVALAVGGQFRNFAITGVDHAATSYQVRNFVGTLEASGSLTGTETSLSLTGLEQASGGTYGSYDVFLFGADRGSGYQASYGDAHFLRIKDSAVFAPRLASTVAVSGVEWEVRARCQMGMGVTRLDLDITTDSVQSLNAQGLADADYLVTNYLAYETANRPRAIIGHFPDYDGTAANKARVTATVAWLKDHGITHWEPRNEPQGTAAATYVTEQAGFYAAVKAGDPAAVVLGPNPVGYANNDYGSSNLTWITDFLAAGGDEWCDEFSYHGYTDQSNIARTMSDLDALIAVLDTYGFTPDKVWQTEGGAYSHYFGSYRPQSWIMQILAQELVGIEWQRNSPWYDQSHGFWDFPSFWLSASSSYPHGLTPRTFIEEIGDRVFEERFDFGDPDNLIYLGGSWLGDDGTRTVAVRAENSWQPDITFRVTGATSLTTVDLFGNTSTIAVTNERLSLPADPHIAYLRVPAGATCTLIQRRAPAEYPTLTVTAPSSTNNVSNLTNGVLEDNWPSMEATPTGSNKPYNSKTETFPHDIVFDFAETLVGRVQVLPLTTGWTWSAVTDIEIAVDSAGSWVTVFEQTAEPVCSFEAYTKESRCRWHECWEPARAFDATFTPVTTTRVRVRINAVSVGTFGTTGAFNAWWEDFDVDPHTYFALKDARVYEGFPARERFNLTVTCSG